MREKSLKCEEMCAVYISHSKNVWLMGKYWNFSILFDRACGIEKGWRIQRECSYYNICEENVDLDEMP